MSDVAAAHSVVLLRGINVGGHRKVPMADLRGALSAAGFTNPRTYVQSGNIVIDVPWTATLAGQVAQVVLDTFGFEVAVVTRDAADLGRIAAANPFVEEAAATPALVHVVFLDGASREGAVLDPARSPADRFLLVGHELFVHYGKGSGNSKFDLGYIERTLGVPGTARNWNTIVALQAMVAA